jgi:hypothetical protein
VQNRKKVRVTIKNSTIQKKRRVLSLFLAWGKERKVKDDGDVKIISFINNLCRLSVLRRYFVHKTL